MALLAAGATGALGGAPDWFEAAVAAGAPRAAILIFNGPGFGVAGAGGGGLMRCFLFLWVAGAAEGVALRSLGAPAEVPFGLRRIAGG